MSISIRGARELEKKLAGATQAFILERRKAMDRACIATRSELVRGGLTGQGGRDAFWGKTGASPFSHTLAVRTGTAKRSIVTRVFATGNTIIGVVGSPLRYLAEHEAGGTIRHKSSAFLRIPTGAMKTGAGVDRLAGVSARTLVGAFIWPNRKQRESGKIKAKHLWIAMRGPSGALTLLYMLVKEVVLKPRWIFREAARRAQPLIRREFNAVAESFVRKAS